MFLKVKDHNAAAVIFIKPVGDSANVMFPLDQENRLNTNAGIPAIQVSREKFIKYFPKGKGLLKIEEQIQQHLQCDCLFLKFLLPYIPNIYHI